MSKKDLIKNIDRFLNEQAVINIPKRHMLVTVRLPYPYDRNSEPPNPKQVAQDKINDEVVKELGKIGQIVDTAPSKRFRIVQIRTNKLNDLERLVGEYPLIQVWDEAGYRLI